MKWAAKKFNLIAPVWFNIKFIEENDKIFVKIDGQHDIDQSLSF